MQAHFLLFGPDVCGRIAVDSNGDAKLRTKAENKRGSDFRAIALGTSMIAACGGTQKSSVDTTNDLRAQVSPSAVDHDGDGLMGSADACLNEAEDFDGFQDTDGCPDPDNDQDKILDAKDSCPERCRSL